MATTYRDMQDRVLSLVSRSDSATRTRVQDSINRGYKQFVNRELWPFREATGDISTVAGTQEYSLSSNFTDLDTNSILDVTLQGATNKKLSYWPLNHLRADQPDLDLATSGVPERYYLRAGNIGLWPQPDAVYTLRVDYYKVPTELSSDSDEPIIPEGYREALEKYALSAEHDYNSDPDLAVKAMNEYEQIVALARNNLLNQPNDTGAFTVLGPADSRSWTGLSDELA